MNDTTILQIPVQTYVKTQATAVAKDMGFSSLQEFMRVVMSQLITKQLNVSFNSYPQIMLSKKNDRRYTKMEADYKNGKNFVSFSNVKDAVDYFSGNKIQQGVHKKFSKKNISKQKSN